MITFFACPKPFQGHIGIIQRNAIESWTRLRPRPEIILLGTDPGIAEICKESDLIHVAEVDTSEYGTPLVSSIFQIGQVRASHPVVCYINSDILLTSDFMHTVEIVATKMTRFLIVGQRWDVDINDAWNFDTPAWEADLKSLLTQKGTLHAPSGIDFFCFPRGMYTDILPFAIGRPGFDNWLVWRARSKDVPIVDITEAALVVHQNHESSYIIRKLSAQEVGSIKAKNGSGRTRYDGNWVELGPEAKRNLTLAPAEQVLTIWAATWMIDRKGRLRRRRLTLTPAYIYHQLKCMARIHFPLFYRRLHSLLNGRR
jgi:hypothetical protein